MSFQWGAGRYFEEVGFTLLDVLCQPLEFSGGARLVSEHGLDIARVGVGEVLPAFEYGTHAVFDASHLSAFLASCEHWVSLMDEVELP